MSDTTIDKLLKKYMPLFEEDEDLPQLKSALYDLILKEVVGEDDETYTGYLLATTKIPIEKNQEQAKIRQITANKLRQEMRNKLKELFDE